MERTALIVAIFLAIILVAVSSCSVHEAKPPAPPAATCQPPVAGAEPETPYCSVDYRYPLGSVIQPKIYIYKNKRRLMLVEKETLIRDYPVGLSPVPSGDKRRAGDGRTPEGEFYVCVKNSASKYYKSLGLSYPSLKHAEKAFIDGMISHSTYTDIVQAIKDKQRPPWNTALGGEIFIHGGGAKEDWTKGCIALYNTDMDELFSVISVGTPVRILP